MNTPLLTLSTPLLTQSTPLLTQSTPLLTLSTPYWAGPRLDPLLPHGGVPYAPNVSVSRIFFATPANGTYNHMPMLDEHRGTLFAWWKNSPVDEDQPGQRILYSQSNDGISWISAEELFPNMSSAAHHAALFAEPMLHLNGSAYIAASPIQFNVYPISDKAPGLGRETLLLRQVMPGLRQFGPTFWATPSIPPGFADASAAHGVRTLDQMPETVQSDMALLSNVAVRPCPDPKTSGNWKCEACTDGCWAPPNASDDSNEFTHYEVPGGRGDVILYRRRAAQLSKLSLAASVREPGGHWTPPVPINISDDNSNLNAGILPDGRVYLLSNAMPFAFRDPLFLSTSVDGQAFGATARALTSCQLAVYQSPHQPSGCVYRHKGGSKQGGVQYPQGLALTVQGLEGFWAIYSLNKEDVWVARAPFRSIP